MSTITLTAEGPIGRRSPGTSRRLISAEFLKLRRRHGLVAGTLFLTVVPVIILYTVLVIQHSSDPARHGPAGGIENFAGTIGALGLFSVVAGILVGATLGTGDRDAGVFRELVLTGRSRLALFAARLPAGLGLLFALVGTAFAISATASTVFAGSQETTASRMDHGMVLLGNVAPDRTLLLHAAGWLAVVTIVSMVLALAVSSLIGTRSTSIGVLLGWWLVAMPLLGSLGAFRGIRDLLISAPLERLQPEILDGEPPAMALATAVIVLLAWTVVPLGLGACRTIIQDA